MESGLDQKLVRFGWRPVGPGLRLGELGCLELELDLKLAQFDWRLVGLGWRFGQLGCLPG